MRKLTDSLRPETIELLERLTLPADTTNVPEYRECMRLLGHAFTDLQQLNLQSITRLMLICTNEDADFLARGVIEALESKFDIEVRLACFWNERLKRIGTDPGNVLDIAPSFRRYIEPGEVDAVLIVKSIISSACVVRANLSALLGAVQPKRILIFAPVVLAGATLKLREDFPEEIADQFEVYFFAEDNQKDGETVIPGIGGQVYQRLGLGDGNEKNKYTPAIVKQRRKQLQTTTT
jgi:hypothetical protein